MAFAELAQLQSDVVNAVLDDLRDDLEWRTVFVSAEFCPPSSEPDSIVGAVSIIAAFTIRPSSKPGPPPMRDLSWRSSLAIERLYGGYRATEEGFTRFELVIERTDGRYRFTFGHDPSIQLDVSLDRETRRQAVADSAAYLAAKYTEMLG